MGTKKAVETTNKVESTDKNKFETTNGVSKKIWNGFKKKSITFGDVSETDTEESITKKWTSNSLPNGAVIEFHYSKKKGQHEDGRKFNPRYILALTHNDKTEKFSGMYARKLYMKLTSDPNATPRRRSNKLNKDTSSFVESALDGI